MAITGSQQAVARQITEKFGYLNERLDTLADEVVPPGEVTNTDENLQEFASEDLLNQFIADNNLIQPVQL
jgi:hypothetical protein